MATRRGVSVLAVVAFLALLSLPACGLRQRFFGKSAPTRTGTLTLTPPTGPAGTKFGVAAGGFLPGESLTFEIDVPGQKPFVGPPHTAAADGTVSSSYQSQPADPPGTYQIKAVGARGTHAQTTLVVTASSG